MYEIGYYLMFIVMGIICHAISLVYRKNYLITMFPPIVLTIFLFVLLYPEQEKSIKQTNEKSFDVKLVEFQFVDTTLLEKDEYFKNYTIINVNEKYYIELPNGEIYFLSYEDYSEAREGVLDMCFKNYKYRNRWMKF